MCIISTNAIHSVFWLIMGLVSIAAHMLLHGSEFIPLLIIIIYAGAIMILFVFVIMMVPNIEKEIGYKHISPVLIYFAFYSFYYAGIPSGNGGENLCGLGQLLYANYSHLTLTIALLLLIAMIGVLLLTQNPHPSRV